MNIFDVLIKRLFVLSGGSLAGSILGAEFISPDGLIKGCAAGIGVGMIAVAFINSDANSDANSDR